MNLSADSGAVPMKPKSVRITPRQRTLLHRLLYRELRKCSTPSLDALTRLGWISGLSGGYELTQKGRMLAEFSEQTSTEGNLDVSLP